MDNRATFGLFLAVGIILGSAITGHAGCKTRLKDLKDKLDSLRNEMENTRRDLKQKKTNDQLTKEYPLTKITEVKTSIKHLKTEIEKFCEDCPHDKCRDIISQMEERIDKLQLKFDQYKGMPVSEFGESFPLDEILAKMIPFNYTDAL